MKTLLLLIITIVFFNGISLGQNDSPPIPASKVDSMLQLNFENQREYYIASKTLNQLQSEINKHKIRMLYYRERRLEWHAFASNIIFVVVLIIVMCGLLFSGIQFYKSLIKQTRRLNLPPAVTIPSTATGSNNEESIETNEPAPEIQKISLSLKGIELSSSVLGVVILVISIAFFYLYLVIVYPINDLDAPAKTTTTAETKK